MPPLAGEPAMRKYFCHANLNPVQSLAGAALLAVALFAWAHATQQVVDRPDVPSVANWLWRLWQLGALTMALAGVWWLWFATRRAAWTRSLALAIYALIVFLNTYHGAIFGDDRGNVWEVINPLFIAFCSVSAVALWRRRPRRLAARAAAVPFLILAAADFVNAYFLNTPVIWWIMNPLMIIAALFWTAAAPQTETAAPRQ